MLARIGTVAAAVQHQRSQKGPCSGSRQAICAQRHRGFHTTPAVIAPARRRCHIPRVGDRMDGLSDDAGIAGFDPMEELGIPKDQRPVNELKALRDNGLYSWALLEPGPLATRVVTLWAFFFFFIGGPISDVTYAPSRQPVEFFLAGSAGALVPVVIALLLLYQGWAYVGNRLLSAVVEYEETGWYDGQTWVKPPKVLARDRLLGNYEVKPTLARVKTALLAAAAALVACSAGLVILSESGKDADGSYGQNAGPRAAKDGPVFRPPPRDEQEEVYSELDVLRFDDEAAAREAEAIMRAQGEVPAYCADRYYRAMAGGPVDCDAALGRERANR